MKVITILEQPEEYSLENKPGIYVAADDFTLQIDIDDAVTMTKFWERFEKLKENFDDHWPLQMERPQVKGSKTPGHYHVTIKLDRALAVEDRLFLQSFLGSDPIREMLSWFRAKLKMNDPILLALQPDEVEVAK